MKIVEQNVELIDYMGSDLSVVNAARVSFHKESDYDQEHAGFDGWGNSQYVERLSEKDQKLISYLAKHNHWTPFGHATLSFRVKAPIFVARQLVKHQVGLVWNEVSRRYVDDEPEFWFPKVWRKRAENVKQGSSDEAVTFKDCYGQSSNSPCVDVPTGCLNTKELTELVLEMYQNMLDAGVAPEQARIVLPQNMMTEWVWTGSLMAFARVCKLRLDPHAQKETQEVAQKINDLVPKEFEHSWKALMA